MSSTIDARVIQKVGTEAEWNANELTLYKGELALVSQGDRVVNIKVGNGAKKFRELPYIYMGGFTDSVTPTTQGSTLVDGMYIANGVGTYTNMGGLIVKDGYFTIISKVGTIYKIASEVKMPESLGVEVLNPLGNNLPQEKAVAEYIEDVSIKPTDLGVDKVNKNTNILEDYLVSEVDINLELWVKGYYNKNNGQAVNIDNSSTAYRSKELIRVKGGVKYSYSFRLYGNAGVVFLDENHNLIQNISTASSSNTVLSGEITLNENVMYMGLTFAGSSNTIFVNTFKPQSNYSLVTSDVFVKSIDFTDKSTDYLKNDRNVQDYDKDTNFIDELTSSDLTDRRLWNNGFFLSTGLISVESNWFYSTKYYFLKKGVYSYRLFFRGNAKCLLYSLSDKSIIGEITNSNSNDNAVNNSFTIEADCYLRISFRYSSTEESRIDNIYFKNNKDINSVIITEKNIKDYTPDNDNKSLHQVFKDKFSAKKRKPILTLICDDGSVQDSNWYIPLLNEFGVKSTLAISKHWVEGAENGTYSDRLNRSQIIEYHKQGHDIANHTVNHEYLNRLTLEEAENEILDNKLYLEDLINDEVPMFVSPFGIRNANLDYIISKYHRANFISGYSNRNLLPLDNFFINRVSFDTTIDDTLLWDSDLLPALESAVVNKEWLVLAIHSAYSTYLENGGSATWQERRDELRKVLQYCKDNNIQVMTAKRAYSYYSNHVDIGIKRYNDSYYKLAMDMSEENINYF